MSTAGEASSHLKPSTITHGIQITQLFTNFYPLHYFLHPATKLSRKSVTEKTIIEKAGVLMYLCRSFFVYQGTSRKEEIRWVTCQYVWWIKSFFCGYDFFFLTPLHLLRWDIVYLWCWNNSVDSVTWHFIFFRKTKISFLSPFALQLHSCHSFSVCFSIRFPFHQGLPRERLLS